MTASTNFLKSVSGLFSIVIFSAVTSCTSNGKSATATDAGGIHSHVNDETMKPVFKDKKIGSIYEHYLHVKNALITSDSREAQLGSSALSAALKVGALEDTRLNRAVVLASKMAGTGNVVEQRAQFNALSLEVEALIKRADIESGKIYKQYCPMANNGNGASWLSTDSDIKNPYYGKEMLGCGEVTEEIL